MGIEYVWNFPGGKVERNESAIDAAHRELFEELGISVPSFSYHLVKIVSIGGVVWIGNFFVATKQYGAPYIAEPDKIANYKYCSFAQMLHLPSIKPVFSTVASSFLYPRRSRFKFQSLNCCCG